MVLSSVAGLCAGGPGHGAAIRSVPPRPAPPRPAPGRTVWAARGRPPVTSLAVTAGNPLDPGTRRT